MRFPVADTNRKAIPTTGTAAISRGRFLQKEQVSMNSAAKSADSGASAYYRLVLLVFAALGIALQAASMGPLRDSFWGFHLYAFLPRWFAVISWIAVATTAGIFLFGRGWKEADNKSTTVDLFDRIPAWGVAILVIGWAAVFWLFRSEQTMLGDGLPLILDLPKGQFFHPREPLAMWLQQACYQLLYETFSGDDLIPPEIARNTVAAVNVLAGALFVLVAVGLARCLAKYRHHGPTRTLLIVAVLIGQGYAVLFYGYIENYTVYALTIALYLWAAVMYLQERAPLSFAAIMIALGVGVHLSTVTLVPSFLFLFVAGLRQRERRKDAVAGMVALAAGLALLSWFLWHLSPGYTLWTGYVQIAGVATKTQGGGVGLSYLFGWTHLRDFLNEQWLAGPLAAYFFVPAVIYAVRRRDHTHPTTVFFALAAGFYLLGSWVMSEPLLGYARDWDLFAPAAVSYCAAGLFFLVHHVRAPSRRNRLLAFAAVLTVVNLLPWVWINHSESLTLERIKTLPLGNGRTEVVVANFYMREDNLGDAELWFKKAIKANPRNVNAYYLLGLMYVNNGFPEAACQALEIAVSIRPDKFNYRKQYAKALMNADRCSDAVTQLMWLSRKNPGEFPYWQATGEEIIESGCGETLNEIYAPVLSEAERLIYVNPRNLDAHVYAGLFLGQLGRLEEAREKLAVVLEIDPGSAAGLYNMGTVYMQMGDRDQARRYLQRFLALHPDHPMAGVARQQLSE
jgi:tetratricopeptide (TPR) repeat protein